VKSLYSVLIPLIWVSATVLVWLWDGPLVFVPGIEGRWVFQLSPTGLPTVTNTFAELSVPTTTAVMRAVCAGVAVASAAGVVPNRFLGELRLPSLVVTGVYAATLVIVGAALFALRSRPEPRGCICPLSCPDRDCHAAVARGARRAGAPCAQPRVLGAAVLRVGAVSDAARAADRLVLASEDQ
jgi:hypothetical protein